MNSPSENSPDAPPALQLGEPTDITADPETLDEAPAEGSPDPEDTSPDELGGTGGGNAGGAG